MFQLKHYQERCLVELREFLRASREGGDPKPAFEARARVEYHRVLGMEGLPYVCLRVPTGGGKTVMAAHAVGIIAKEYLRTDPCVVLWLAPSTKIVQQTLEALRDREHPYRQALDAAFEGRVMVTDLEGALYLSLGTLQTDTVVVVSTLAASRVEDEELRRVFRENGQLTAILEALTDEQRRWLLADGDPDATKPTLANVLRSRRPVVIVDEAHGARTDLSFTTLKRFGPSCVLELTATPKTNPKDGPPSNVISHVSAAELKAEEMIKLPVRLRVRGLWKEAVDAAIRKRAELEKAALAEERLTGQYIRPVLLFQAEPKGGEATVEVLKKALIDDFKLPAGEVAVCTGSVDELGDKPMAARDNPIRYIITVQKLREGWDCPFAYVLCSVANLSSKVAVEQLLGRVLRMPYAQKRRSAELNEAYAYATSMDFRAAAEALTEAIVESGFERFEAQRMVVPDRQQELGYAGPLFGDPIVERVSAAPAPAALAALPAEVRSALTVRQVAEGAEIVYQGPPLTVEHEKALSAMVAAEGDRVAVARLARRSRGQDASPAALGQAFRVPALAVEESGQRELLEDQLREAEWDLAEQTAALGEAEFSIPVSEAQVAAIDVDERGHVGYQFVQDLDRQMLLLDVRAPTTVEELVGWLDREVRQPEITQIQSLVFLRRVVGQLMAGRGFAVEQLVAHRHRLAQACAAKIAAHRLNAEHRALQELIGGEGGRRLVVDQEVAFAFPAAYPAPRLYRGRQKFSKHFYPEVAEMNDEEAACAAVIDALPQVEYWVRNLAQNPTHGFWLQTPTGKFYPDFVALLIGERYLVVEYKGAHLEDHADTKTKQMVGELWAARSEGDCIFLMIGKEDYESRIRAAVG